MRWESGGSRSLEASTAQVSEGMRTAVNARDCRNGCDHTKIQTVPKLSLLREFPRVYSLIQDKRRTHRANHSGLP